MTRLDGVSSTFDPDQNSSTEGSTSPMTQLEVEATTPNTPDVPSTPTTKTAQMSTTPTSGPQSSTTSAPVSSTSNAPETTTESSTGPNDRVRSTEKPKINRKDFKLTDEVETKRLGPNCTEVGRFPHSSNCTKYYYCWYDKSVSLEFHCPEHRAFDPGELFLHFVQINMKKFCFMVTVYFILFTQFLSIV